MTALPISIRRLTLLLLLIHTASLYRISALDDHRSNSLSSLWNDEINPGIPTENLAYSDEEANDDHSTEWLSPRTEVKESPWKRSFFSKKFRSANGVPQRRNYRPHWNPLVAAYKRCGELSTPGERETCFKDAIQMLFVQKLRK